MASCSSLFCQSKTPVALSVPCYIFTWEPRQLFGYFPFRPETPKYLCAQELLSLVKKLTRRTQQIQRTQTPVLLTSTVLVPENVRSWGVSYTCNQEASIRDYCLSQIHWNCSPNKTRTMANALTHLHPTKSGMCGCVVNEKSKCERLHVKQYNSDLSFCQMESDF